MNPYRSHENSIHNDMLNALDLIERDFDPSASRFSFICMLHGAGISQEGINKAMASFWPKEESE